MFRYGLLHSLLSVEEGLIYCLFCIGLQDSKTLTERLKNLKEEASTPASASEQGQTKETDGQSTQVAPPAADTQFLDTLRSLSRRIDQIESVTGSHPPTFSNVR